MSSRANIGKSFHNRYKQRDAHPDMRGDVQIDLRELFGDRPPPDTFKLEIASWWNKTRNGDDYLSHSLQLPRPKGTAQPSGRPRVSERRDEDAPW